MPLPVDNQHIFMVLHVKATVHTISSHYWWCVHAKSLQSYLTLCDPMDCSLPGSSVHGILQARILEWVALQGNHCNPGIKPTSLTSSALSGGFFTTGTTWDGLLVVAMFYKITTNTELANREPTPSGKIQDLVPESYSSLWSMYTLIVIYFCFVCISV